MVLCLFFQAEDGIRDIGVTGVQACALPISAFVSIGRIVRVTIALRCSNDALARGAIRLGCRASGHQRSPSPWYSIGLARSEERRVGKECRSRWPSYH